MNTKKVTELSDEMLLECMKDYLQDPIKYFPEYSELLINDYKRRIKNKRENACIIPPLPQPPREFINVDTSTNATMP